MQFADKIVLITGASSGMGRAAAIEFSKQGASIIAADINEMGGEETCSIIEQQGGAIEFIQTDVASPEQVNKLFSTIDSRYGHLDCAFNNAGIAMELKPFTSMSWDEWQHLINNNLSSFFLCMQHEIKLMQKNNGGSIVNNSSIASLQGFATGSVYSAAKGGVNMLSRSLAKEVGPEGIRINVICPGFIDTPMSRNCAIDNPDFFDETVQLTALKRAGSAAEVGKTAVWLCSDAASFIVGQTIAVDGGYLA